MYKRQPTDGLESLINGMKKVYTGKTVITLSEDATAEQPILKMTNNPMGLTEFMYDMLRKETVENDMYWYYDVEEGEVNPYMAMMELIGLSKTSLETFEMTLDNIRVDLPQNGVSNVEFLGGRPDILSLIHILYSRLLFESLSGCFSPIAKILQSDCMFFV